MSTLLFSVKLTTVTCCNCGMTFAMPSEVEQKRRSDHDWFYCPAGHRQYFPQKSEAEKLRDDLARTRAEFDQEQAKRKTAEAERWRERERRIEETTHLSRRINGYKGVTTRMKRRAMAGRCPCCTRQFKDLERHMKNQHPKFDPDHGAEALAAKEA